MGSMLASNDVRIMVERRGHGSSAWFWRLFDDRPGFDLKALYEANSGYRSAEDAYDAAKIAVRQTKLTPGLSVIKGPNLPANPLDCRASVPTLRRHRLSPPSGGAEKAHTG
jgi:hypothetical protein